MVVSVEVCSVSGDQSRRCVAAQVRIDTLCRSKREHIIQLRFFSARISPAPRALHGSPRDLLACAQRISLSTRVSEGEGRGNAQEVLKILRPGPSHLRAQMAAFRYQRVAYSFVQSVITLCLAASTKLIQHSPFPPPVSIIELGKHIPEVM